MAMSKTKQEIIDQYVDVKETDVNHVFIAMEIYAEQEAIAFANWLSNLRPSNKPIEKLWEDFKED